ncbi:hypothetical protein R69658_07238 [Paraburkholderia aspalathi]|uniref:Secreted protein n=1 Tax=Paraburkholderia aspalathi TaxID=1324617 RepID=A0ABM8T390_9BURK|nr:hypothetical protein R69658_07238 [Paraburkholderia aspalathi]
MFEATFICREWLAFFLLLCFFLDLDESLTKRLKSKWCTAGASWKPRKASIVLSDKPVGDPRTNINDESVGIFPRLSLVLVIYSAIAEEIARTNYPRSSDRVTDNARREEIR